MERFSRFVSRGSRRESHIPPENLWQRKSVDGEPVERGRGFGVRRVCTAEEVGKRPSGSRLLRFFPLCRSVSLRTAARRSLKKDFALCEGGGGATDARNSGISRVLAAAGEEDERQCRGWYGKG